MLNKKALLTGFSLLAVMGLIGTPVALAATDATSIVNSGDDVDIDTTSSSSTNVNVNNTNIANVTQQVTSQVNTGNNSADQNISLDGQGTGIMTGNAMSQVGLNVDANHNMTAVAVGGSSGDTNMTDIVNTGDDADIDTTARSRTRVNVNNFNQAFVQQAATVQANSGNNDADQNIGDGPSIMTGNAGAAVGFNADVNHNDTAIALGSGLSATQNGDGNFTSIVNTGDDLDADTRVRTRTRITSNSTNIMSVLQSTLSQSNTGDNDADQNIGGTGLMTGAAGTQVGSTAGGNHNATFFGDIMDMLFFWMS